MPSLSGILQVCLYTTRLYPQTQCFSKIASLDVFLSCYTQSHIQFTTALHIATSRMRVNTHQHTVLQAQGDASSNPIPPLRHALQPVSDSGAQQSSSLVLERVRAGESETLVTPDQSL